LTATKNQNQVVVFSKQFRSGKDLKQGWNVLAMVSAANRQQGRSLGVTQKWSYQRVVEGFSFPSNGVKQGRIHTGRNQPASQAVV